MATQITANQVRELGEEGAQLLEVLPRREGAAPRIPGAISIPLKELDADAVMGLNRETAVIVYCWDSI
jgi:rhodanese-related sulfurtransferase